MALNIILDLVLLAIIISGVLIGAKKGFVKIMSKPLKPLLAILLAFICADPIATGLIEPIISEPVVNQINNFLYDNCAGLTSESLVEELPTLIKLAAMITGLDLSTLAEDGEGAITALVEQLAFPVVHIIAVAVAFVIVFIVVRLLLALLFSVANSVFDTGALKVPNRILGCLACSFLSLFVAWGVVSLFEYVIHFPRIAEIEAVQNFTGGLIYNYFKQYNPVELLLSF